MKYYLSLVAVVFALLSFGQNTKLESAIYQVNTGKHQAYTLIVQVEDAETQFDNARDKLFTKDGIFAVNMFEGKISIGILSFVDIESIKGILQLYYEKVDIVSKEIKTFK